MTPASKKNPEVENQPKTSKEGNLSEFRTMILTMIQGLGKRMRAKIEKMQEMFNKHLEELKKKHLEDLKNKQTEMKNTITEMKYTLDGINSRITEAEERISDLETEWWNSLPWNRKKKIE